MADGVNLFVLYKIIKELTTPFADSKAFELGVIDEKGKLLKSPSTKKEKEAYSPFHRFIFNIKRILARVGLESKMATFAAALFLLKEENCEEYTEGELLEKIYDEIKLLQNDSYLYEEIANATGAAVAGTGSDGVHWVDRKRKEKEKESDADRYLNALYYLKKTAREAAARDESRN